MSVIISPSMLGANFCNLEKDIKILEKSGITSIHIDVMDGNFVPNIAFGIDQIKMLTQITNMEIDVHLMINDADRYIESLVEAGADSITVHQEACPHLYKTLYLIKSFGIKAGVSINPATSLENLRYIFHLLNKVLIMTVEPGFGGQKFIPSMKQKIKDVRLIKVKANYQFEIQVDGGINKSNIKEVAELGVTDIVIGSSLFDSNGIENNIKEFYEILNLK